MPRLQSTHACFVLQQGQFSDTSGYLVLDPRRSLGGRGGQSVAILFEPLEPSPAAERLAAELGDYLARELEARRDLSATAALLSAIETTNDWLVQVNAVRPARERQYFGFTCILNRGDDAYVAQEAPSQVLIAQEGEIYAFPGLEHWRWHQQQTDKQGLGAPLGWDQAIQPDLYHTTLAEGDLIVLCSSSLARVIDRAPQDALASGRAEIALNHLDEIARLYSVTDGWAAVLDVAPSRVSERTGTDLAFLRKVSEWCSHLLPEETARRFRPQSTADDRHEVDFFEPYPSEQVDLESQGRHTLGYATELPEDNDVQPRHWEDSLGGTDEFQTIGAGGAAPDALLDETPAWEATDEDGLFWAPGGLGTDDAHDEDGSRLERRRSVNELIAGAVLALSAAVVGVRQISVGRDRLMGPRDDGTLGMPRLSRYDDSYQLPDMSGVRSRLPRLPISRSIAIALVVLIVAVGAGLSYSIHVKHAQARKAELASLVASVDAQRQTAQKAADPAAAQAALQGAQASLAKAQALGLDQQQLAAETAGIQSDMDHALKIERLANVQVLGSLPPAPAGVTPRIFSGNGQLYVFTDALYRLDNNGTTLVRLIGGGDNIAGKTVGTLDGAAWGDGAPIVFDGTNAYLFDPPTGKWNAQQVGSLGGPQSDIAAINGYSGNLYLLSPASGQIIKYTAGAFDAKPEDWTAGAGADDLKQAVDFMIDGHIYVLTQDGRIDDFYMSAIQSTITPKITPPITKAVSFSLQTDRPYVYVADSGRILRLNRTDGSLVQQFMPGDGSPAFNDIRGIAVDDILSTAYVLNGNTLMSVRLPGPPH